MMLRVAEVTLAHLVLLDAILGCVPDSRRNATIHLRIENYIITVNIQGCRRIAFRGWRQGCCQPPECRPATSEGIEKANIKRGATYTS